MERDLASVRRSHEAGRLLRFARNKRSRRAFSNSLLNRPEGERENGSGKNA